MCAIIVGLKTKTSSTLSWELVRANGTILVGHIFAFHKIVCITSHVHDYQLNCYVVLGINYAESGYHLEVWYTVFSLNSTHGSSCF